MSTDYLTLQPCTIAKACKLSGWVVHEEKSRKRTEPRSAILCGEGGYVHAGEIQLESGAKHLAFTRFGGNDPETLIDALNGAGIDTPSEYEEEFDAFMDEHFPYDEEDEE